MIASAFDLKEGLGVIVAAPPCDDEGWTTYIQRIQSMLAILPPGKRPVLLQVLRDGVGLPSPTVRKALAELRKRVPKNAISAAIVESASVRMMQIAVDWLHKPHYESRSHANFDAAIAHLEGSVGRPLPTMRMLYRDAMSELKTR